MTVWESPINKQKIKQNFEVKITSEERVDLEVNEKQDEEEKKSPESLCQDNACIRFESICRVSCMQLPNNQKLSP